jgi:hypothetical protein
MRLDQRIWCCTSNANLSLKKADDISESIKFIKPIENSQPMNETTSNRIEETALTTL